MDWKVFVSSFVMMFLSELGDKTQLAALTLSAESKKPWSVMVGGTLGLVLVTALAVAAGEVVGSFIPRQAIQKAAAFLFMAMGIFFWFRG